MSARPIDIDDGHDGRISRSSAAMSAHSTAKSIPTLHDIIIIGAGACGLAVAARLCEHTPSAIFTDEEHQRYHWIRKHGRKMSIMKGKGGCVVLAQSPRTGRGVGDNMLSTDSGSRERSNQQSDSSAETADSNSRPRYTQPRTLGSGHGYKSLVLDASADQWMANWNRLFKAFGITHLRSPMFFHVDPRDRDGLLAYTYEKQRKDELREIKSCVGKEISKHRKKKQAERMSKEVGKGPKAKLEIDERDRKDYYVPSRSLFNDHCDCIINRYGLNEGYIRKETVQDIDFGTVLLLSETEEIFTLTTDKAVHYARAVVTAVGAGNKPVIPDDIQPGASEIGICHSNQIKEFPPPNVREKIETRTQTNIVIVGGGLTSAQLSDLAIRHGVTKVWHMMRGDLKVKPFDVSLEWMGKFKNHEKAIFWSADSDEDRLKQIQMARNGGSITPPYHQTLKSHVATRRLSLHTHTVLSSRVYDYSTRTWSVTTDAVIPDLPKVDYIYFATGIASDFSTLPFLQTMLRKYPLHGHGGFPCLSEDLMWRGTAEGVSSRVKRDGSSKLDGRANKNATHGHRVGSENDVAPRGSSLQSADSRESEAHTDVCKMVPLFVTGRLASLRLGPGAGNLEGARVGAERIAWALQEILAEGSEDDSSSLTASGIEESSSAENDRHAAAENDDRIYRYCAGIGSRFESLRGTDS